MENSNPQLKRDERQNLKTKYKNQRLQEAKEIYLCECQKIYLSFPALYLHVKNKHKVKLTTKITDKICKMEEKNGKTFITYFLTNQNEQQRKKEDSIHSEEGKRSSKNDGMKTSNADDEEKCHLKSDCYYLNKTSSLENSRNRIGNLQIKSIVDQFIGQIMQTNLYLYHHSCLILNDFVNYIEKCCKSSKQFECLKNYQPDSILNSLPLYFNQFICFYLPKFGCYQIHQCIEKQSQIQIMKLFGNWLRQKNYTNFLTQ